MPFISICALKQTLGYIQPYPKDVIAKSILS